MYSGIQYNNNNYQRFAPGAAYDNNTNFGTIQDQSAAANFQPQIIGNY